jgi:hypothetical protein
MKEFLKTNIEIILTVSSLAILLGIGLWYRWGIVALSAHIETATSLQTTSDEFVKYKIEEARRIRFKTGPQP